MFKPGRTFILFLVFFGGVFLLAMIFPEKGIQVNDSVSLRFWNPSDLLKKEKPNNEKLKQLLANTKEITDSSGTFSLPADTLSQTYTLDSLISHYRDTLHTNICYLEYPCGDSSVLFPFFKKLSGQVRQKSIHILHYGDSQIEVDRISSSLRRRFQKEFGGGGIGLFSLNSVNDFSRFVTGETSANCERYGTNGKAVKKTGILSSLARFTSLADSTDSLQQKENFVKLVFTGKMDAPEQSVDYLRVLYGQTQKKCRVDIEMDEQQKQYELYSLATVNSLLVPVEKPVRKIKISFLSSSIPDLYALSLEDSLGILVDNVPLRGAAMVNFRGMDPMLFSATDSILNIGLIIMEFGVNVSSNVVNSYAYYRDIMAGHIQELRRASPDMACIVMGISDVAGKSGNGFETMKNIELIRDAQREAARLTNCAFWDTYKAMGGRNSMPAWVANHPPLAQKDFIHLTPKGADLIGEMLYNAILLEYYSFLKQTGDEETNP